MSLSLDLQTIRDRFLDQWDQDAIQTLFANGEPVDVDETEGFVRFSINPGSSLVALGGTSKTYDQIGRVILQVFVPVVEGLSRGYDLVDAFIALYRDWRSDDGMLRTGDHDIFQIPGSENDMYQINVSIRWSSLRRL